MDGSDITINECSVLTQQGSQCERCKPNFVGDPTDNGQCIPCSVFCHGHTAACSGEEGAEPDEPYREGARARCLRCANHTDGPRCERCLEGYFRGSDDFRDPCRPYVCPALTLCIFLLSSFLCTR